MREGHRVPLGHHGDPGYALRAAVEPAVTRENRQPAWTGDDAELLTADEAAELLRVRVSTLRAWAREGRIGCVRLGPRATRWTRPLLRAFVAAQTDPGRPS